MASAARFKFMDALHRTVFTATNGKLMGKFYGMPVVMLTTKGRETGHHHAPHPPGTEMTLLFPTNS